MNIVGTVVHCNKEESNNQPHRKNHMHRIKYRCARSFMPTPQQSVSHQEIQHPSGPMESTKVPLTPVA